MAARSDNWSVPRNGLKLCRVHRRRPATTRHIAQALLMTCRRCVVVARMSVRRRQMSKQFRDAPRVFVRYHGFKFPHPNDRTQVECEGQKLEQNRDGPFGHPASSVLLRDDHIVLAAIMLCWPCMRHSRTGVTVEGRCGLWPTSMIANSATSALRATTATATAHWPESMTR